MNVCKLSAARQPKVGEPGFGDIVGSTRTTVVSGHRCRVPAEARIVECNKASPTPWRRWVMSNRSRSPVRESIWRLSELISCKRFCTTAQRAVDDFLISCVGSTEAWENQGNILSSHAIGDIMCYLCSSWRNTHFPIGPMLHRVAN